MTILLIEMTDYSNVQKVIKIKPAVVFLLLLFFLPSHFPFAENISDSKSELGKPALKGDVSFPSLKRVIIIRISCHVVNIHHILTFTQINATLGGDLLGWAVKCHLLCLAVVKKLI